MRHKGRLLIATCLFLLAFTAASQDWKQVYNEALSLYQNQKYQEALSQGKQALALSRSLDTKSQAYTLQLLTSICLESNKVDEGLTWITEEEYLFQKIEGTGSAAYIEGLRKHSLMLLEKGSYPESREKCTTALGAMKANKQQSTLTYATMLAQGGQLAALMGDFTGASVSACANLQCMRHYLCPRFFEIGTLLP